LAEIEVFSNKTKEIMPVEKPNGIPIQTNADLERFFISKIHSFSQTMSFQAVRMGSVVIVKRPSTREVVNITVTTMIKWITVTEEYLCTQFGLNLGEIVQIYRETAELGLHPGTTLRFFVSPFFDSKKDWLLCGGTNYCLVALGNADDEILPLEVRGKAPLGVIVTDLSDDSDEENEVKVINPGPVKLQSTSRCKTDVGSDWLEAGFPDHVTLNPSPGEILDQLNARQEISPDEISNDLRDQVYRISALQSLLQVRGSSKVSDFVQRMKFVTRHVICLPPRYNGDIIFELPPIKDEGKKGDRVRSMERAKYCYYWTQIVTTLVKVLKVEGKQIWEFDKMLCIGALECRNDLCDYYSRNKSRNASAWMGNYKMSVIHCQ
jgi:hypothetical protein